MKVNYEITDARPDVEWLQVRYTNDAGQEFWKNLIHTDWTQDGIEDAIKAWGPEIAAFWERTLGRDNEVMMQGVQSSGSFECEPENFLTTIPEPPQISEPPEFDPFTHRIEQVNPEIGDEWIQWEVIELTDAEKEAFLQFAIDNARGERNFKLAMSDWIFAPDAQVEDMDAWLEYRQALRDVPLQPNWPKEYVWPKAPNER